MRIVHVISSGCELTSKPLPDDLADLVVKDILTGDRNPRAFRCYALEVREKRKTKTSSKKSSKRV